MARASLKNHALIMMEAGLFPRNVNYYHTWYPRVLPFQFTHIPKIPCQDYFSATSMSAPSFDLSCGSLPFLLYPNLSPPQSGGLIVGDSPPAFSTVNGHPYISASGGRLEYGQSRGGGGQKPVQVCDIHL